MGRFDKFIVTGLPRSRTGWLAALLTYGSSFCLHDGLQHGPDLNTILDVMSDSVPWVRHMGNSDSGHVLINEPADFKDYKVVVVIRDIDEAKASFTKFFEEHPYPHLAHITKRGIDWTFECAARGLVRMMTDIPEERLHKIFFHDLDDSRKVEALWDFVVPEQPFCKARFIMLNKLRVNPASEKVRAQWV